MSQQINQLCQTIAKNPSKINLINQALTIASTSNSIPGYQIILQLFQKLIHVQSLKSFLNTKIELIFQLLLEQIVKEQNLQALSTLGLCFRLSTNKMILRKIFLEEINKNIQICGLSWPSNLLIFIYDELSQNMPDKGAYSWEFVIKMIVDIPHFTQLNVPIQDEADFKKSFQRLLIGVLGNENIPKLHLYELYHNLGQRVLSKLSNPLILSNHCLSRFALDPQIQIQVLSCLFLLVGKYGLQLEEFYPKLQKLIKYRKNGYSIYELPNSKRFFRLIEAALRSSKVPFKTISNLTKIIISQIANQKSQFAFWALSFVINLTKKHRKLLDEIPTLSQIKMLKYHYNSKIKTLIKELSMNLNKMDYYEIEQFVDLDNQEITRNKMQSLYDSLSNEEIEFKVPMIYDKL